MPRKPRIHYDGAFFHVTHRGNNRGDLFFERIDRARYLELVIECIARFGCTIHAFCLMTNHVHLLIEVASTPLSRVMHNLSFRFASWINHQQNRSGHVFQGRYDARLVDTDDYLLAALRYIHRNPVEGNLVRRAVDYEWSGHRTYLGAPVMQWVKTNRLLGLLGETRGEAIAAYRNLIDSPQRDTAAPAVCFSDLEDTEPLSVEIVLRAIADDCGLTPRQLRVGTDRTATEARALVTHVCRELRICRVDSLARIFCRDGSTLRQGARRLAASSRRDARLRRRIDRLLGTLHRS